MSLLRRKPQPEPVGLDDDTRAWLAETVEVETAPSVWPGVVAPTTERKPRYEVLRCPHCQGVHFRACPRVKTLLLYESGATKRVEFWPDGSYDDTDTIWPEHVFTDSEATGTT